MKRFPLILAAILALVLVVIWGNRVRQSLVDTGPAAERPMDQEEVVDSTAFRGPLVSTLMIAVPQEATPEALATIQRTVESQYGALFDVLTLPEAQRGALTNALAAYVGFWALKEDEEADRPAPDEAAQVRAVLWDGIAEHLTSSQQRAFLEYDADLAQRLLFEGIDLPLHIAAQGLPEETIAKARDILVEQFLQERVGLNYAFDGPGGMTPSETIEKQRVAVDDTLRAWRVAFPKEQLDPLEGFLDRQRSMLDQTAETLKTSRK